jgi:hypothetical protein
LTCKCPTRAPHTHARARLTCISSPHLAARCRRESLDRKFRLIAASFEVLIGRRSEDDGCIMPTHISRACVECAQAAFRTRCGDCPVRSRRTGGGGVLTDGHSRTTCSQFIATNMAIRRSLRQVLVSEPRDLLTGCVAVETCYCRHRQFRTSPADVTHVTDG